MTVTWFSDGQPSYNTMVDIDTNMFNMFQLCSQQLDNFLILIRRSSFCCCFYMLLKSFTFSTIWKDFLIFSPICWLYVIYSLNICSSFKWDMQFANFTEIACNKILVHWTDIMLWWNIQPVWSMSSSVMADRGVIFLNMTYNFSAISCYFLLARSCLLMASLGFI